jgi:hypothetical protein
MKLRSVISTRQLARKSRSSKLCLSKPSKFSSLNSTKHALISKTKYALGLIILGGFFTAINIYISNNTSRLNSDLSYTSSQQSGFNIALAVGAGVNASIAMTNTDSETEGDSDTCKLTPSTLTTSGTIITCKATITVNTTSGGYITSIASSTNEQRLIGIGSATDAYINPTTGIPTSPIALANSTWGYAMPSSQTTIENNGFDSTYTVAEKDTNSDTEVNPNYDSTFTNAKYAQIPTSSSPVTIRTTDVKADNDTFDIYFVARLNYNQKAGRYSGSIVITIDTATLSDPTLCKNAALESACKVDIDDNMIPIKYTGTTSTPTWSKADPNTEDDWYDYGEQKWANAVTLNNTTIKYNTSGGTTSPTMTALSYFKDADANTVIPEADILGYWVYVPRYAYEVQRLYPFNKPACGNGLAGDDYMNANCDVNGYQSRFDIRFEKSDTVKKIPTLGNTTCRTAPTSQILANTYTGGVDYRSQACHNGDITTVRTYGAETGTTWATHPAFTLDKNSDGNITPNEELNGIWIGKYEVGTDIFCANANATNPVSCGANIAPTNIYIKPNKAPMTYKDIGAMFTIAKNMSPNASSITGGNTITNNTATNTMSLTSDSMTYMMRNNNWGAITYLSASIYGATGQGNAKVYNNGYYNAAATSNSTTTFMYKTGCGPVASKSDDGNTTCNLYYTDIGQQASTTGNVYGIYDMAGGTFDYIMGNYNNYSNPDNATPTYMATMPANGFINKYLYADGFNSTKPTWSSSTDNFFYYIDKCTFAICGGQSNYEATFLQSISSNAVSWNSDYSSTSFSSSPWVYRGGRSGNVVNAGIFASTRNSGVAHFNMGFRVALSKF